MTFKSAEAKRDAFHADLLELFNKYNAELQLERIDEFGYNSLEEMVVIFDYDYDLSEITGSGSIPNLKLGRYV